MTMLFMNQSRDQEDRQFPVLFRFRIRQTDLFREKRKKIGPKINLFSVEYQAELKYSRSFKMVTKLHNRSKQLHFPAQIHQLSLCLLYIIGQSSIASMTFRRKPFRRMRLPVEPDITSNATIRRIFVERHLVEWTSVEISSKILRNLVEE